MQVLCLERLLTWQNVAVSVLVISGRWILRFFHCHFRELLYSGHMISWSWYIRLYRHANVMLSPIVQHKQNPSTDTTYPRRQEI